MTQLSQSKRRKVFDKHGHECRFCGMDSEQHMEEYDRDLEVHHIIPQRAGGSDELLNLIPVCQPCHNILENTQADALQQIKEEAKQSDKVRRLEVENEHLRTALEEQQETIKDIIDLSDERLSVKLYVVHETRLTTSRLLYVGEDSEKAQEEFENAENHVTMETARVYVSDWVDNLPDGTQDKVNEIESTLEGLQR